LFRISPGWTTLTVIPCRASSTASVRANDVTAGFEAAYMAQLAFQSQMNDDRVGKDLAGGRWEGTDFDVLIGAVPGPTAAIVPR
jgi:hypothetical protein